MEGSMKLTIIAATGGVGRQLLEQALDAGHAVTTDLTAPEPAALEAAIAGTDAVLSGLGPHSNSDAGVASRGTRAIVAAMRATNVRRVVAISAGPVSTLPSRS